MRGAIVAFLLFAALSGAPSRASAGSNDLADPTVTPTSGSTLTIFTFTVRYEGAFAATTVTAAVAGLDLAMTLVDGSMSAGTWAASSTLPAGAWATTFIAYAEQGNVASVTGPAVTVTAADAGTPVPSGPERHMEASREPVTATEPATAPVSAPAEPAPSTGVEPSVATPPAPPDEIVPAATAIPVTPATGTPSVGGLAAVPAGSAGSIGPSAVTVRSGTDSGQTTSISPPSADGSDELTHADDPTEQETSIIVLIGFLGVGAIALLGTAMLIARRRRARDDAEPIAATAAAALQRRSVRRARQRMGEDPIMAAMGIGGQDKGKARRRPPPIDGDRS